MKRIRGYAVGGIVISVVLLIVAYLYENRVTFPQYHLLKIKLMGDAAARQILAAYETQFVPEQYVSFTEKLDGELRPRWAFRPSHAVPTYPVPVVDDTDGDGVAEVYLGSYTRELYVLDGRDGTRLWDWKLPFGVVGGIAVGVTDLENDGEKEVIFGSNWTLPIRVYALRTDPGLAHDERLKWVKNVSGDFIEAGFNIVRGAQTFVVAATRDAPYSRGSLNIIDANGNFHYAPISGLDNCLSRVAVGTIRPGGAPVLVHGSHAFYGAKYGHRLTARELNTGQLLWSTELPGDTGYQNHQVVDVDFDGRPEIVAFARPSHLLGDGSDNPDWRSPAMPGEGPDSVFVLNGETGEIVGTLDGGIFGSLPNENILLISDNDYPYRLPTTPTGLKAVDAEGRVLYRLPQVSFGVRFAGDGRYRLVNLTYVPSRQECAAEVSRGTSCKDEVLDRQDFGQLVYDVYDSRTGAREQHLVVGLSLPSHERTADYGVFGPPAADDFMFSTLADTDGDGNWNALIQIRDFIVDVHLPIQVHPSYDPYAPIAYRNVSSAGYMYDWAGNEQTR
ncbi:uncharacterized protein METZ01_LOCUS134953 [marine metagenome]|uniref:PilC beta-propeller domain-containing protein n=1 Tax=marine metagenome TaxID=408172 RepID=A0A381YYR4_9ZZZZ